MKTCYQLLTLFDVTFHTVCIQQAILRLATWLFYSIIHFPPVYLK